MRRVVLVAVAFALASGGAQPDTAKQVDAISARWTRASPGCAVGVGVAGKPVLERAYGMADLEWDAPKAADTIFDAGSVSKQFTAAEGAAGGKGRVRRPRNGNGHVSSGCHWTGWRAQHQGRSSVGSAV